MLHENAAHYYVYNELREVVDGAIKTLISGVEPPELREALHHGTIGGKRIRPMLTMLSCSAVGGSTDEALPAAAAIELLHTSSLVHDDIMDCAKTRRGSPSVHNLYGNSMAILAGDTLTALAFRLMQDLNSPSKERIVCRFSNTFLQICEGQGHDLVLSRAGRWTREVHRTMVEKKTALLMESAAAIGAMCGAAHEHHIQALARFGFDLGMAFQAKDDVLDVTGDEKQTGKQVGADRRNGKVTFLNLPDERRVNGGLGLAIAVDQARKYTHSACFNLDSLPPTPPRDQLLALADFLLARDK